MENVWMKDPDTGKVESVPFNIDKIGTLMHKGWVQAPAPKEDPAPKAEAK